MDTALASFDSRPEKLFFAFAAEKHEAACAALLLLLFCCVPNRKALTKLAVRASGVSEGQREASIAIPQSLGGPMGGENSPARESHWPRGELRTENREVVASRGNSEKESSPSLAHANAHERTHTRSVSISGGIAAAMSVCVCTAVCCVVVCVCNEERERERSHKR